MTEETVSEQMAAILGFVVYSQGGEVRVSGETLRNPPEAESHVEAVWDDATDELVIRLVPIDSVQPD